MEVNGTEDLRDDAKGRKNGSNDRNMEKRVRRQEISKIIFAERDTKRG